MRIDLGDDEAPEIGLIALIDCIFFLLMFFMVATSFKHVQGHHPPKDLPITLPTADASLLPADAGPDPFIVDVDASGRVLVGGEALELEALRQRLHDVAARDKSRPVRIQGDVRASYQDIVHVLDLCEFEGLTHVALRTRSGR